MDLIHTTLSLIPVPALSPAWKIAQGVWSTVQQVSDNKNQLTELVLTIVEYLDLIKDFSPEEAKRSEVAIQGLEKALRDIEKFCQEQADLPWYKRAFKKDDISHSIRDLHRKLLSAGHLFNIKAHVDAAGRQAVMQASAQKDHAETRDLLQKMTSDFSLFCSVAQVQEENSIKVMADIQKELVQLNSKIASIPDPTQNIQQKFLEKTLSGLQRLTPQIKPSPAWTTFGYHCELGERIGQGGYANVYIGKWHGQVVAIKEFKGTVEEKLLEKEAELWYTLRGDNIVQMYAASVHENPPFMVMQFIKNGTVHEYLARYPDGNRAQLVHDAALGLRCLHVRGVIHGDLKGANILVNKSGTALLSDFGLSSIKQHIRTQSIDFRDVNHGSLRWSSPERIRGRLGTEGDIYSLGITIWEIFSGEVPFKFMPYEILAHHIVKENGRPNPRPSGISDALWSLAESCWVTMASERPVISVICQTMERLINVGNSGDPPLSERLTLPSRNPFRSRSPGSDTSFHLDSSATGVVLPDWFPKPSLLRPPRPTASHNSSLDNLTTPSPPLLLDSDSDLLPTERIDEVGTNSAEEVLQVIAVQQVLNKAASLGFENNGIERALRAICRSGQPEVVQRYLGSLKDEESWDIHALGFFRSASIRCDIKAVETFLQFCTNTGRRVKIFLREALGDVVRLGYKPEHYEALKRLLALGADLENASLRIPKPKTDHPGVYGDAKEIIRGSAPSEDESEDENVYIDPNSSWGKIPKQRLPKKHLPNETMTTMPALQIAIKVGGDGKLAGSYKMISTLLEYGALVDSVYMDLRRFKIVWTALHWASFRGDLSIVRLLLDKGSYAHIRTLSDGGEPSHTPLHCAAQGSGEFGDDSTHPMSRGGAFGEDWYSSNEPKQIINLLLDRGAAIDATVGNSTALHMACRNVQRPRQSIEAVKTLVSRGCNPELCDPTPVEIAIECQNYAVIEYLLSVKVKIPASVLVRAIEDNDPDSGLKNLKCCLKYMESPLILDGRAPPLVHAAQYGYHLNESFELLIKHGANVNDADSEGRTPLHMVALSKNIHSPARTSEFLLRLGGDATIQDQRGMTPLHIAASRPEYELIKLLLKHARLADLSIRDRNGMTAFHHVATKGDYSALQPFVDFITKPNDSIRSKYLNLKDNEGRTPLHHAAINRRYDAAKCLISYGANPRAKDKTGRTARGLVEKGESMAKMLLEAEKGALGVLWLPRIGL